VKKLLTSLCGLLAALALFAIMWLTLVDVSGRKLLSQSLPGSLELTELLMVVVIFAGRPLLRPASAAAAARAGQRPVRAAAGGPGLADVDQGRADGELR
jgi:hypothetical protein